MSPGDGPDESPNDPVAAVLLSETPPVTRPASKSYTSPPLVLKEHDLEVLAQSDGFSILRQHLVENYCYPLCNNHKSTSKDNQDCWLLMRDVLHSLLVPVVELFDKACAVAAAAIQATKPDDLEYAFTAQARSAFVWLQCFLASDKERDWCYTRGCPACVIDHSLDSEFTIRLLCAACLLSDVHYPFTLEGPTLPSFMFFLESLETAIHADELFGEDFFERMRPKALTTSTGIESLIHQCLELDLVLSQPSSPDPSSPATSLPPSPVMGPMGGQPGMKVRRSRMAKRQMKMQLEEEQWMEIMMNKCWDQLPSSDELGSHSVPTQSLEAILKSQPVISVQELVKE